MPLIHAADRHYAVQALIAVVALLALLLGARMHGQALRHGTKLPVGPPRYYLRAGSVQEICAPYVADGKPAWSCPSTAEVIRRILKDCEGER